MPAVRFIKLITNEDDGEDQRDASERLNLNFNWNKDGEDIDLDTLPSVVFKGHKDGGIQKRDSVGRTSSPHL